MSAEGIWLLTSLIGIIAASLYIANVASQIHVARAERLSLQQPQLWGQLVAGLCLGVRMCSSTLLGILAVADSPLAREWGIPLLSGGNVLTVLAMIVLIVALNWTVHQDDETIVHAESNTANVLKATADNKVVVEVTGVALEAQVSTEAMKPKEPEQREGT